ncbi:LytR/AlgR family response regulator transcription factor [Enterococcus sp. LJL128]
MRIALFDENIDDLNLLQSLLLSLASQEHELATFDSGLDLLKAIGVEEERFDIYFLAVEGKQLSGIEAAEAIRESNLEALIIFLSEDMEKMASVFKFQTFDYLLKPVLFETLKETVERARRYFNTIHPYFEFSFKKRNFLLSMNDISYIGKSGRIAYIHTENEIYKSYLTMSEIMNKLNPDLFIRIHGSYVVNLNYVTKVVNGEVFVRTKSETGISEAAISISRTFKEDLKSKYAFFVNQRRVKSIK